MSNFKDSKSFSDFANFTGWMWTAKRITFRHYGNGNKRPMYHRFEVRGGVSLSMLMAENVTKSNALFRRLQGAGKLGSYETKGVAIHETLCYGEQPAAFPHLTGTPACLDDCAEPTTRRPDPPTSSSES